MDLALASLASLAKLRQLSEPEILARDGTVPSTDGGYISLQGHRLTYIIGIATEAGNSERLGRQLLGLDDDPSEWTPDDCADSLGELANILAGQIKTDLAARGQELLTSLPWFISGRMQVPSARLASTLLQLNGVPVWLLVHRQPNSLDYVERRRAEAEIADRENRLRAVLDGVLEGIVTIDEMGIIEAINAAGCEMLGSERAAIVGRHVNDAFGNQLFGAWKGIAKDNASKSCRLSGTEFQAVLSGKSVPIEVSVTEFQYRQSTMLACIFRDISARKALELDLRQSQKLQSVGRLAAGIAHEINTPTQFVSDNVNYLAKVFQRLLPTAEQHQQLVQAITNGSDPSETLAVCQAALGKLKLKQLQQEVPSSLAEAAEGLARIASIVRAMKSISHPSAGTFSLHDVRELIQSTATVCRNEWKYVAEMKLDFDEDLPAISCLRDELGQTLLNMIVNSAQAIASNPARDKDSKGLISISARRIDDAVEISVTDTGCGIAAEHIEHVFDPFFTTKAVGSGTGQGLSIAYNVVKKHNGAISIKSVVGEGTNIRIQLPIVHGIETEPLEVATVN